MLKMNRVVAIIMAVLMASFPLQATKINMLEDDGYDTSVPESVTFAVVIEPYYYTVILRDGIVQKIEKDGTERPEFVVRTNFDTAVELITRYNEMTWLEKLQFLVVRMNVPYDFIEMLGGVI